MKYPALASHSPKLEKLWKVSAQNAAESSASNKLARTDRFACAAARNRSSELPFQTAELLLLFGAMNNPQITKTPIAKTGLLIRKGVGDVFEAIVNPEITSKFWFSKGSGRLETSKTVQWDWENYDVSIAVTAKSVERNKRVLIEWPGYSGPTTVEWTFQPLPDGTTFVRVSESGWTGDGDELIRYVADSTQGFTLMLAGLKALLEHNVRLNLTNDRYPKGVEDQVIGG